MRPRRRALVLAVLTASFGCSDAVAPRPLDVVVSVSPRIAAVFASLGGTVAFSAGVADTLGKPLTSVVAWAITPASTALSIGTDGTVTIAGNAAPGDYRIRATSVGATDSVVVRVLPRPTGKLVFSAVVGGNGRVFGKDFATDGVAVPITSDRGTIAGLAVDQTSGAIFFSRGLLPNVDIFKMNIDGTSVANLTNNIGASNQGPTLNPVTHDVYFTRQGLASATTQVFRMRQDGSSLSQVTTGTQSKVVPAISPDGSMLAWSELYQPGNNLEVVTSPIAGDAPVRFTSQTGADGNPFWMSSTRILWAVTGSGQFDIFSGDIGTTNFANLTNGAGSSAQPSLGCASNTVTMVRTRNGETAVYQFDLTTGLAAKYTLPVTRVVTFARRQC